MILKSSLNEGVGPADFLAPAAVDAVAEAGPMAEEAVAEPETAEPVAAACGFKKPLVETGALSPNAEPLAVLHELARLKPGTALLVGHQPHLGRLFGLLLSGRSDLEIPMKKAGLAAFETGTDPSLTRAELKFYLPPRLLEELS